MKLSVLILVSSFFILVVSGCATYKYQKQLDAFEKTTDSYGLAIRWGYYEMAYNFLRKKENENHPPASSAYSDIKVSSYEVQRIIISENKLSATQMVEIKYYHIKQMIQRTLTDRQLWKYDVTEKKWYLHSGLPDFR